MNIKKVALAFACIALLTLMTACGGGAKGESIAHMNKQTKFYEDQTKLLKDGKFDQAKFDAELKKLTEEGDAIDKKHKVSDEEAKKMLEDAEVKAALDKMMKAVGDFTAEQMKGAMAGAGEAGK